MLPLPEPRNNDSRVVQVLRAHRANLDGMEAALMDDMGRRWLQIEQGLDADISALAFEMARRRDVGEVITKQMVWRAERYKIIKAQLQAEVKKYNSEYAIDVVEAAQRQYSAAGIQAAQDAIYASYPSPLSASFNKINLGAVESMIGFAGDGSPLYSLLKNDYPDAVDGLTQALVDGLARGLGPGQIGRDMANGMGMGLDRALLIARTEAARSYRTASTEQYRQSGVVGGFMRLVKKETACAGCLMLDGELFDTADELDDHPRGKCMVIPIVEGVTPPQWQKGQDWFLEQSEADQQRILGPQKWQAWKDSGLPVSALAKHNHSDVWGSSPRPATISELEN
jgi:hypothetical protein